MNRIGHQSLHQVNVYFDSYPSVNGSDAIDFEHVLRVFIDVLFTDNILFPLLRKNYGR
jgi:hypothetical protein